MSHSVALRRVFTGMMTALTVAFASLTLTTADIAFADNAEDEIEIVKVPAGVPCKKPKQPDIPERPADKGEPIYVHASVYSAGQTAVITASGYGPGEKAQLLMYGGPIDLGTHKADKSGIIRIEFEVPADPETNPGMHRIQLTGYCGRVSTGEILVGRANASLSTTGSQGIPFWVWCMVAAFALIGLIAFAWRLMQAMTAPPVRASVNANAAPSPKATPAAPTADRAREGAHA